jgi:hypothetical protein
MRTMKIAVVLCLFLVAHAAASGMTSVYAIVEKVVFEPNEANAERIQLWGAFSFVGHEAFPRSAPPAVSSDPIRGYLYFSLPPGHTDQLNSVRTEWADLKAAAGTGQAVSFGGGQWMYVGAMSPAGPTGGIYVTGPDGRGGTVSGMLALHVVDATGKTSPLPSLLRTSVSGAPTPYFTNTGLVKLAADGSHAEIVKKLRAALAAR